LIGVPNAVRLCRRLRVRADRFAEDQRMEQAGESRARDRLESRRERARDVAYRVFFFHKLKLRHDPGQLAATAGGERLAGPAHGKIPPRAQRNTRRERINRRTPGSTCAENAIGTGKRMRPTSARS
jgi:hypothetical protein